MGTLYLVSTPIGNLEDLSPRAVRILGEVDSVLAEDTRRTRNLMQRYGLSTPMVSLHAHNEASRAREVLSRLSGEGTQLALVSDAGTPLVSDPGERLVARVLEGGHEVVPLPGPSAVLTALVGSGLPVVPFSFLGFVPRKGKERAAFLDRVEQARETVVLFESPQRIAVLLSELAERCDHDREVAVGRELTKLHEEFRRGTLDVVARYYQAEGKPRGEVTVVIAPSQESPRAGQNIQDEARALAAVLLNIGASPTRAAREVASLLDVPRNRAYQIALDVRADQELHEDRGPQGAEGGADASPDEGAS